MVSHTALPEGLASRVHHEGRIRRAQKENARERLVTNSTFFVLPSIGNERASEQARSSLPLSI